MYTKKDRISGCEAGCRSFTGGEIKHHKDCQYYEDSISQMLDKVKEIAFGNGSAQERMVDIKALFNTKLF